MQSANIRLLIRNREAKNTKSGAFLSTGLMTNFLSLNDMFRISLHGKPMRGVILNEREPDGNCLSKADEIDVNQLNGGQGRMGAYLSSFS